MPPCPAKVYIAIHAKTLVLFKTPVIATRKKVISLFPKLRRTENCFVFANVRDVSNIREVVKTRDANERIADTHTAYSSERQVNSLRFSLMSSRKQGRRGFFHS